MSINIDKFYFILQNTQDIEINYFDISCQQSFLDAACQTRIPDIINALIIACDMGNIDVVDRLLNSKFDINTKDIITGLTPLIAACKNGYLDIVDRLILVFGVNDELIIGGTMSIASGLTVAIMMGHMHIVDRLIDSGANVNYANYKGESALMVAVRKKQPDAIQKLLDNKADITFQNANGETALDLARECDAEGSLIELLEDALAKQESREAPRRSMS